MTSDQPALFDVAATTDQQCEHCHATLHAGHTRTPECAYDRDRDGRRPPKCLNTHRPEHAPIPY